MKTYNFAKLLSIFLWLVALHSFFVGLGLIFMPSPFMEFLGYGTCKEIFFRAQGGVFHIAMAVGYGIAAFNSSRFECLVIFSIIVKLIATVFLFSYSFFVNYLAVILLSGISDLLMGILILILYKLSKSRNQLEDKNEK